MIGKHSGIPVGMIFKKFYCSCCGNKLTKEKHHRVVSPGDIDYYSYNDRDSFPKYNTDVYGYHFKCIKCLL